MIRTLVSGILAFSLFLVLQTLAFAEIEIRVGVYGNRPLLFNDAANGKPAGLFIDILEDVAKREGWKIQYISGHWHELLEMLGRGEIDLLPAIAFSRERSVLYDFTYETVITNWAELYTSRSKSITSLLELDGVKIGVKQDDIHYKALRELTSKLSLNSRFIEADSYLTVMEMLDAEYVKVGVVNRLFGTTQHKRYQVRTTPVLFNPVEIRFAAPKQSKSNIIRVIDRYLRKMKMDEASVYHSSVNRWLMVKPETSFSIYLLYYLVVAAFLALVFLLVAFKLRLMVQERSRALISANKRLTDEIRERREKEEELRKLAEIVSASDDLMALLSSDGVHLTVNEAYRRFANKVAGLSDVIDLHIEEVFGRRFYQAEMEGFFQESLRGDIAQHKAFYPPEGDQQLCLHMKYRPSANRPGKEKESGVVLDIRDITEQWRLEESLKNAQKMEALGMLAGGVAHDLNNILSGVVGYPDMLLAELPRESRLYDPLLMIKQSGKKAAAVVSDLLTLARRSVDNREPIDFNKVVSDFLSSPEHHNMIKGQRGLSYKLALDPSVCPILGNRTQLSKVVMNLVLNASEAMPNGGIISIRTRRIFFERLSTVTGEVPSGEYIVFSVADSGVGIEEGKFSKIFEPFYTSKVMGKSGTGLGMAIVYGIVKDHEGFIDVQSERNKGTTFSLYFPISGEAIEEINDEYDLTPWHGKGELILVIDDLVEQRVIASEMLTRLGYITHTAPSGEEGIKFIEKNQVDLVILDMIMPGGMDGLSTYREIVKLNSSLPTIIASGFSQSDHVYKAQRMGAGLYLKKPYTMAELAKAVHSSLNRFHR